MYKRVLLGIAVLIVTIQCERLSNRTDRYKRAFNTKQKQFQQQVLTAHNKFRARHCVSPLQLDKGLSRSAQRYAELLARTNTFKHSGTKNIGENLQLMSSSQKITKIDGKETPNIS